MTELENYIRSSQPLIIKEKEYMDFYKKSQKKDKYILETNDYIIDHTAYIIEHYSEKTKQWKELEDTWTSDIPPVGVVDGEYSGSPIENTKRKINNKKRRSNKFRLVKIIRIKRVIDNGFQEENP